MKRIVSVLGTVLLVGSFVAAQTGSSSGTSNKSSKKATSNTQNGASASSSSDSNSAGSNSGSTPQAGTSGFDAGDSSAGQNPSNSGSSSASSGQTGSSAYGSTAASTPQAGSSASNPSYAASGQSGSSDAQSIANGPVAETVGDSSALIGWATRNAASNTGLKYGANRVSLSQTAQGTDGSDGKNHHTKLQGLSPSTRYYFQVTESGEPVGGIGTFKTTAAGETPVQSKAVIPQK